MFDDSCRTRDALLWQFHSEGRALSGAWAFDANGTAVEVNHALNDRKPQSQAAGIPRLFSLPHRFEHVGQQLLAQPDARIGDAKHMAFGVGVQLDRNGPSIWSELDCIRKKIPDH